MLNLNISGLIHSLNRYFKILSVHTHSESSIPPDDYCVFKSKAVPISFTPFINHAEIWFLSLVSDCKISLTQRQTIIFQRPNRKRLELNIEIKPSLTSDLFVFMNSTCKQFRKQMSIRVTDFICTHHVLAVAQVNKEFFSP